MSDTLDTPDIPVIEVNKDRRLLSKKELKGKYYTRVLAVQCLYAIAVHSKAIEKLPDIRNEDIIHTLLLNALELGNERTIDQQYFLNLVDGVYANQPQIDDIIEKFLSESWSLKRIAKVMQSILRLATYEILSNESDAKAFLINDYLEIVKLFNHEGEVGFANGILDKIEPNVLSNSPNL